MIEISNNQFFTDVIRHINDGKNVKIRAKGFSMLPLIRQNKDVIILSPLQSSSLQPRKIILAYIPNKQGYILHRIEKIDGNKIILRGDGNVWGREICSQSDALAEARAIIRGKKIISDQSIWWKFIAFFWPKISFFRRVLLFPIRRLM